MDWYFGHGTEDFVVPKGQELAKRLSSAESWLKWGITAPVNFEPFNKCFVTYANLIHDELRFNGKLCNDDEFESSADVKNLSCCSSICEGLSDEYLNQATLSCPQPDYQQLDDFARFEQIDDIFLNSTPEDLPGTEDLHNLFCSSPKYQCGRTPTDYHLTDAPIAKILVPPEQSANGFVSEALSLEESVLQELEMVMAQLSDEIRICFRDSFYRLAKNSKQNPVALNEHGNIYVRTHPPKWTISEVTMRSAKKETTEAETNTIDRTIANLTFNKMEINVGDIPAAPAPANSKPKNVIKVTGQLNQSSSHSQIHCFPQSVAPTNAEVPCLGH